MPTSLETFESIAQTTGLKFFTAERTARALREFRRDCWVTGGRGGGKNVARVSPAHFANLLRGLSGLLPSDAPAAFEKLQRLSALYRIFPQPGEVPHCCSGIENIFGLMDGPEGETFECWIERCLMNLVDLGPDERRGLLEDVNVRDGDMHLNPYDQRIRIEWGNEFVFRCALVFGPADHHLVPLHKIIDKPRARRITVLPLTALVQFACLLAAPSPPIRKMEGVHRE
jgi:hypothetical protein